jgi:predicted RNA-binding protein with RPS1 domain
MENYLEILKDSLIKKIRILEEIVKIDDEQTTLFSIDKDNEERIRETFDRKSALIDEINRMDAGFESVFEKVKEQLDNRKDEYKPCKPYGEHNFKIRNVCSRITTYRHCHGTIVSMSRTTGKAMPMVQFIRCTQG